MMQVCLHHWLKEDLKAEEPSRDTKRVAQNQRYAVLALGLETQGVPDNVTLQLEVQEDYDEEPPIALPEPRRV